MPGQNYGYDEDMDGILKPQKMPSQDSTIGPAYYNVIHVSYDDSYEITYMNRHSYYDMLAMPMKLSKAI